MRKVARAFAFNLAPIDAVGDYKVKITVGLTESIDRGV